VTAAEREEVARVVALVASVPDPELPFVTISDLGILRSVEVSAGRVRVCVTPTYSGCPATETIVADVRAVLAGQGYVDVAVETVLSPAWTTDWMSERGREALREHGIAPPGHGPVALGLPAVAVRCPWCRGTDTEELARFGATACKSLWRCRECREPFEVFKQH
jgi:ring-1,2-phenylacetyl-CoA epoxidase subunit PaaD